ncbi:Non-classical arabinogalactan protein 30 [Vitis vinifera]|uniref:Non-classical arabinogalactan protein 30 n=1 Tax=Vitis vinifera TaxID=29760 RepID=A0A438J218_VITVI|nr:Non-classical arabinogalactan protein 30 [Vitis vinifera]
MESRKLKIFISSCLLLSLAFPSVTMAEEIPKKPEEKTAAVVVEGMVYCQSCDQFGSWSLTGAEPIPAAKVSVICKDHKDQVSFYKAFETDGNGYFYAELDGFKISHNILDHPLHSCHVKLVYSPLENCNLLSNVNYGLYGSPLRYENKRLFGKHYEAVIYAAGPLAFRPAHCPPKTHD